MSIKKSNTYEITNTVTNNVDFIDEAIFESEKKVSQGAEPVDAQTSFSRIGE